MSTYHCLFTTHALGEDTLRIHTHAGYVCLCYCRTCTHTHAYTQVLFTPGVWLSAPVVALDTYVAGERGGMSISFTPSNPLPADANIIIEMPHTFASISTPTAVTCAAVDGDLTVAVDSYVITVTRSGRYVRACVLVASDADMLQAAVHVRDLS